MVEGSDYKDLAIQRELEKLKGIARDWAGVPIVGESVTVVSDILEHPSHYEVTQRSQTNVFEFDTVDLSDPTELTAIRVVYDISETQQAPESERLYRDLLKISYGFDMQDGDPLPNPSPHFGLEREPQSLDEQLDRVQKSLEMAQAIDPNAINGGTLQDLFIEQNKNKKIALVPLRLGGVTRFRPLIDNSVDPIDTNEAEELTVIASRIPKVTTPILREIKGIKGGRLGTIRRKASVT